MNEVAKPPKAENPFLNIAFNIVIPVVVLNKLSVSWGALQALVVALAFPLAYGVYDILRVKKVNFIVIFGILNVLFTGGLALLKLEGFWFAIKEAAFPLLVGVFVFASAYTRKPFVQTFLLNEQLLNLRAINEKIDLNQKQAELKTLLKTSTQFLSLSFLLSAVLNFVLALWIFNPIEPHINGEQRDLILNAQIGQMTKYSFLVIMLPSMICLMAILFHFLGKLSRLTGLDREQLLAPKAAP